MAGAGRMGRTGRRRGGGAAVRRARPRRRPPTVACRRDAAPRDYTRRRRTGPTRLDARLVLNCATHRAKLNKFDKSSSYLDHYIDGRVPKSDSLNILLISTKLYIQ